MICDHLLCLVISGASVSPSPRLIVRVRHERCPTVPAPRTGHLRRERTPATQPDVNGAGSPVLPGHGSPFSRNAPPPPRGVMLPDTLHSPPVRTEGGL